MDCKPKFKPLVVIRSYEDRECRRQLPSKLTDRRSTLPLSETLQEKPLTRHSISGPGCPPPPPPPPPTEENERPNRLIQEAPSPPKPKAKVAPPVPVKYSTLSYAREKQEYPQPPPCPTPDYDTISINSNSTLSKAIANRFARNESRTSQNTNDNVEMESLESYRLNNPSGPFPKPPSTYFNRPKTALSAQLSNGSTTSSSSGKKQRPVSVTIGEYPSGTLRKQPGKLDFLQNGSDENDRNSNGPITSQFASELAHTLSRSNLRKRTESMENLLNGPQIKPQSNGSVTISLNNTLSKSFAKSTDNLNLQSMEGKSNRVTISISSDKKADVPNGILKNGNGNHNFHSPHKPLVQQKSITFGEM